MWGVLCSLLLVGGASASSPEVLERNLVFRSPYSSHPGLALDTKSIHARHLAARGEIETALKKREAVTVAGPSGSNDEYTYSGYGLQGVAYWNDAEYIYGGELNFTHGVASGDPFDYSVLLWTRAYPTDEYRVDIPMCVEYKVYAGEDASGDVVTSGWALTNADVDFTIKVEALGLFANTYYSYQFSNCADPANTSPVGRTRTAPGKTETNVAPQRFAIYSCSNHPNGFFSAYSGPTVHQDTD